MQVAHEAPLKIMTQVSKMTDYDYGLVHLFEENEEYVDFFNTRPKGRKMILDNSLYELGKSFDADKFFFADCLLVSFNPK